MKIAEVVAVFPPRPGGTGYVCYHNARELARRGHDVTVFTLDHPGSAPRDGTEGFRVVPLRPVLRLGGGGMVPQLCAQLRRFDAVHLHYPFFGGAEYVLLASLVAKKRYLLTYHQDVQTDSFLRRAIIGTYERLFLKAVLRRADRVGMLSAEHLRSSKASELVDWGRVVELPNGVDTGVFAPRERDADLVARYGLQDKTVVLFVGHLLRFKGLHVLLEALAMLGDRNVVLVVVGTGALEQEYRDLAARKGLADRVIFAGYQSQDRELPRYYDTCDMLVLPSVGDPESFGMVVIEAMASGKPAIVSSLRGPAQLIDEGKDGFVAPVGDAEGLKEKIAHLVREKDLRRDMGAAARRKVIERYSWERIGDRLESILLEITGTSVQ